MQLGKRIAGEISVRIDTDVQAFDPSTQGLLALVREHFPAAGDSMQPEAGVTSTKSSKKAPTATTKGATS